MGSLGTAVSVPPEAGGETRRKAVGIAALTGAPTVLGAVLGYCVGAMGSVALAAVAVILTGMAIVYG